MTSPLPFERLATVACLALLAGCSSDVTPLEDAGGENRRPVARVGDDIGQWPPGPLTLSGRTSYDPDGDPLTYRWRMVTRPAGSQADLDDPARIAPSLITDEPGDYEVELVVSDGMIASAPATLSIRVDKCAAATLVTTFEDGEFAAGDWTQAIVEVAGVAEVEPATRQPSGGNPGAYLRVVMRVTPTAQQEALIFTKHTLQSASYDPSFRPICSIRMSIDSSDFENSPPSRESASAMFLEQDGNIYATDRFRNNTNGWASKTDWTEEDFVLRYGTGPAEPVLDGGAPVQFGFIVGASRPTTAPGPSGDVVHWIDNVRIELVTRDP